MERSKMEKRDKEKLAENLDALTKLLDDSRHLLFSLKHFKSWYADTSDLNEKDEKRLIQIISDVQDTEEKLTEACKNGMLLFLDIL